MINFENFMHDPYIMILLLIISNLLLFIIGIISYFLINKILKSYDNLNNLYLDMLKSINDLSNNISEESSLQSNINGNIFKLIELIDDIRKDNKNGK